ncbi:alpha-xylosidase [Alicyclobacillus fructus]|uniref:alpha-xylosidase n=1 Tax=Alicyclobacillus fructus TaxID=2816082 RepID=UPI001A8C7FC5|nr:alpha-xylosidase [Alicyclobacillus fructus]
MKFTDGNWLVREGVSIYPGLSVQDWRRDGDGVLFFVACRPVANRGHMLDGPMLTCRISFPRPGMVRIEQNHFLGRVHRGPHFPLEMEPQAFDVIENEDDVVLCCGELEVRVRRAPWSVAIYEDGRFLTESGPRSAAYVLDHGRPYMRGQLHLSVGEWVYGLGERFTAFVKNGQSIDIWNRDGGTGSDQAYKSVPFYLTNRGYGVFVNHPECVSFEVGTEFVSKVQFSVEGERLDYFVIGGGHPKAVIERYTALTGRPALPPQWSFGLWLSTSFTTDYDETTVSQFVDGMAARGIPLSVFHFDCFWMKPFEWCNFAWDTACFPDPEGMLARLKSRGLKICVWINPYIAQKSPLFQEAMERGYLLRRPNGDVWQWDLWQPGMGIVDFTNPDARRWYQSHLRRLLDMGVDAFKTDFGERIPTDVVYHDGSDPAKMHNFYSYLYNEAVWQVLCERGRSDAVVFARSATAGGQRFPVHWGGDCRATYESMAETLRGGLSLALCGFGFWSHDIGGFEDTAPADLYKRWIAFGLFSSHSRLHGSGSYRVPWLFDEESVEVLRHFVRWKLRLMPYLWSAAVEAHRSGVPMLRPMMLEFPDDPTCDTLDRQYMLGSSLLIAPVFSSSGEVTYYLPAGVWTHLFTGEVRHGGRWYREQYDFMSLPVFVREGSVLALSAEADHPECPYARGLMFHVYRIPAGQSASCDLFDERGQEVGTFRASWDEGHLVLQPQGGLERWRAVLHGLEVSEAAIEGAECRLSPEGVEIIPQDSRQEVRIACRRSHGA